MSTLSTFVGRSLRAIAVVSPALAGRIALRLFFVTTPRIGVSPADAASDLAAERMRFPVRGREIIGYAWGSGERTVLLIHGWRGRASQFAPLIRELIAEGFRVVSFDAPAHGRSSGGPTDMRDWIAAAETLQQSHGPFHAVVGHSMGGLAALTLARSSMPTGLVAVISAVGHPDPYIAEFAKDFGLNPRTAAQVKTRFQARLHEDEASAARRYDAVTHPLPPETELLVVHDRYDRRMPDTDARRLHAAHDGRSRMVRTSGFGHTRVLAADVTLDAVTAFVTGGLSAVADALPVDEVESEMAFDSR
ncbi:MAG: alpha/beta fold hydrolase [Microbacterium sp.]|uniref:alpha/beta fold hydrolase n=1 Tax=Microbacterium sp. TaxID=51671 RepID=UPI003BB15E33